MITVTNLFGQTATIDEDLKVTGNEQLKTALESEIKEIDIDSIPVDPLAFVYYDLEKKGYSVSAPKSDFEAVELPPDAVG